MTYLNDQIFKHTKSMALFLVMISLLTVSESSFAVNTQQYSRSSSVVFEMIEDARLENSYAYSDYEWLFNLGLSHIDSPLIVKNDSNSTQLDKVISNMTAIHFGAAWNLKSYLQLGVQSYYANFDSVAGGAEGGLGDVDLKLKIRLLNNEKSAFAIMPQLRIPTSQGEVSLIDSSGFNFGDDAILSDEGLGYGLNFIYERIFSKFQLSLNLGILFNSDAEFVDSSGVTQIDFTQRLKSGFGIFVPLSEKIGVNAEYMKHWSAPLINDNINPNELYLGASFGIRRGLTGFGGVSLGNIVDSDDGNDYRLSFGVKYTPQRKDKTTVNRRAHVFDLEEPAPVIAKEVKPVQKFTCGAKFAFGNTNQALFFYGNNKHMLGPNQRGVLDGVAEVFIKRENQIKEVRIYGHTSSVASSDYNKILGRKRAKGVNDYLVSKGVNQDILVETESRGEESLASEGETEEAHKNNRRTEVTVIFKEDYKKECE